MTKQENERRASAGIEFGRIFALAGTTDPFPATPQPTLRATIHAMVDDPVADYRDALEDAGFVVNEVWLKTSSVAGSGALLTIVTAALGVPCRVPAGRIVERFEAVCDAQAWDVDWGPLDPARSRAEYRGRMGA